MGGEGSITVTDGVPLTVAGFGALRGGLARAISRGAGMGNLT